MYCKLDLKKETNRKEFYSTFRAICNIVFVHDTIMDLFLSNFYKFFSFFYQSFCFSCYSLSFLFSWLLSRDSFFYIFVENFFFNFFFFSFILTYFVLLIMSFCLYFSLIISLYLSFILSLSLPLSLFPIFRYRPLWSESKGNTQRESDKKGKKQKTRKFH